MKRSFLFPLFIVIALIVTPVMAANTFTGAALPLPGGLTEGFSLSVWGVNASDIHAVGYGTDGSNDLPLAYRYDGTNWTPNSPTLPGGLTSGSLRGSWGSGPNDIYAVGFGYDGTEYAPLMYHYDGANWSEVPLSVPGGWTNTYLYGVWGFAAGDVYVAAYGNNGSDYTPLIYHYDGLTWTYETPALPGGWTTATLYNVWGTSPSNLYAVGQGTGGIVLYHYNGTSWSDTVLSNPAGWSYGYMWDFWGTGPNNIYLFGGGTDSGISKPLIYHFNGSSWTNFSPALPSGWNYGFLFGGWGSGANDIYAIGFGYDSAWNAMPLVYHYDGVAWTDLPISLPVGISQALLWDGWGSAMNNLFAVGYGYNGSEWVPFVYHGVDTTAPIVTVPSDITAEATSSAGAVVNFTATATDDTLPANPAVTCVPPSGSTFPLSTTLVTCSATDDSGNTGYGYFNVTVQDTTPPTLNIFDITVPQTIPEGAVVNYSASATDLVDGSVPINCAPTSGSIFPVGTTTVNCSATDSHGNTANGSFDVTVTGLNLLKKPDFASANVFPTPWQAFGFTRPYTNVLDCVFYNFDPCSVLFTAGNRSAMQRVNRTGAAGDTYAFGMYSAANNVPAGGKYLVEVGFYNNFSRLVGSGQLEFNIGTHGFELVNGTATATGNYTRIAFRFYYHNPSGRAWFDDAFLYALPAAP